MELSKSGKIFIRNVTVLDVALLFPDIGPRGRSWYVDVLLEGAKDDTGIVFDFSLAKKSVKNTIDTLFDHRLIAGNAQVQKSENRYLVQSRYLVDGTSSFFALNTYLDGIALVSDEIISELKSGKSTALLEQLIASEVKKNAQSNISAVAVRLREHENRGDSNYFTYTHSLKFHYGNCQRFHGHSNIVEVFTGTTFSNEKSEKAASFLDGRYLISETYLRDKTDSEEFNALFARNAVLSQHKDDLAFLSYEGTQGTVSVILPKSALRVMPEESTIENIAQYIHSAMQLSPDDQVFAYEGLQKGALSS